MNHGKYDTPEYKEGLRAAYDRRFGPEEHHTKNCKKCGNEFNWFGRKNTKAYGQANYCSISCRNYRGEGLDWAGTLSNYRTICFAHHEKKCIVCGEENVVEVHHYDEDSSNNSPENLIPLCPTHHQYVHSQYAHLVEEYIENYRLI